MYDPENLYELIEAAKRRHRIQRDAACALVAKNLEADAARVWSSIGSWVLRRIESDYHHRGRRVDHPCADNQIAGVDASDPAVPDADQDVHGDQRISEAPVRQGDHRRLGNHTPHESLPSPESAKPYVETIIGLPASGDGHDTSAGHSAGAEPEDGKPTPPTANGDQTASVNQARSVPGRPWVEKVSWNWNAELALHKGRKPLREVTMRDILDEYHINQQRATTYAGKARALLTLYQLGDSNAETLPEFVERAGSPEVARKICEAFGAQSRRLLGS